MSAHSGESEYMPILFKGNATYPVQEVLSSAVGTLIVIEDAWRFGLS